jgi:hypothetical protein
MAEKGTRGHCEERKPFDKTAPSSVEALRAVSEVEPRRSNLEFSIVKIGSGKKLEQHYWSL